MGGGVLLLILISVYLLPAIIAMSRGHHNWPAIAVLNFFLGWTFLGWVIALVWAFTVIQKPQQQNTNIGVL